MSTQDVMRFILAQEKDERVKNDLARLLSKCESKCINNKEPETALGQEASSSVNPSRYSFYTEDAQEIEKPAAKKADGRAAPSAKASRYDFIMKDLQELKNSVAKMADNPEVPSAQSGRYKYSTGNVYEAERTPAYRLPDRTARGLNGGKGQNTSGKMKLSCELMASEGEFCRHFLQSVNDCPHYSPDHSLISKYNPTYKKECGCCTHFKSPEGIVFVI